MRLCFNENSRLKRRKYEVLSNLTTAWKLRFSKVDHMNKCKVVVIVSDSLPFILLCLLFSSPAFFYFKWTGCNLFISTFFTLKDSRLLCPESLCICVTVSLLHLCECVCHRTMSGRWHFSASITIAPSVPLSLQPWRRVMSPVSLETPTYNACPPQIPAPPYPTQPVHHPLTLTFAPLDLAVSPVPQLLSSFRPPYMTPYPSLLWLLSIQMANHHTLLWLFQSYYWFSITWP